MSLAETIQRYRAFGPPRQVGADDACVQACEVAGPADRAEIIESWHGADIPPDVAELWAQCREARLFVDVVYGQWGLALLSPAVSAEQTTLQRRLREIDFQVGDVVIGKFIGDQELLVVAPAETGARRVMVALEMDPRADWPGVGPNVGDFLAGYWEHSGEKYWQ